MMHFQLIFRVFKKDISKQRQCRAFKNHGREYINNPSWSETSMMVGRKFLPLLYMAPGTMWLWGAG